MSELYRSKEQRQFASRIKSHLSSGGAPLLLEGAAGLGKTRAYLAPLLATGKPVAICVPTRALAAQLVDSSDMRVARTNQSVEVFTPLRNFENVAQYKAHKVACLNADVLICTHQAALMDALSDGAFLGLKDRHAVLFDEADQLPDAAALRFDCAIDKYTLKVLDIAPTKNHRQTVDLLLKRLPKNSTLIDEPASVKAACAGILDALDEPVWYQTVGLTEDGDLRLVHKLPARVLKRLLSHERLIFVSATLSINGTFDDFKRALGLSAISTWSAVIEPVKHGQLDIVTETWNKDDADHFQKIAAHVQELHGTVLVIVASYDDADALYGLLPSATTRAFDEAKNQYESTGQAAARMLDMDSHILIATGAWAGLDTPIRWRHVVMPKAPYGVPTVLDEHEISRYVDSKNLAIRRFRQGLARGLRTPDSYCTLHLLDERFQRTEFLKALPERFNLAYQAKFGTVELRTRQAEFRQRIFDACDGRCVISDCSEAFLLEAAHIGQAGCWRTNHKKGLLLRADLHKLMDAGKLEIINGVVHVYSEHGKEFDGKRISVDI